MREETMGKPVILMDLDSVTVNLMDKWFGMYNNDYNDNLTPSKIKSWDTHKYVKPECGYCIYDYLALPGFFLDLPFLPGAEEGMHELSKVGELVIVTSASDKPQAVADKLTWVQTHLPMVKKGNTIVTSRKDLVHGDIMVDDSPANLKQTLARHKIVLDYPYNRRVKDAQRVYDWAGIVDAVKEAING
jgi:5'(3')-deoxyribonucleotidase